MTPRISPGDLRDVGAVNWLVSAVSGRVAGTGPPNLFLTLGRNRGLFRGWLHFAGRMMPGGKLPRRDTELVILRVAHLRNCEYEFEHHRHLARSAGLSDTDVERVVTAPDAVEWSARQRALLAACDELDRDRDVSDATWDALRQHLDDRRLIEFLLLVGHYQMLATTIATLRIEPDRHT
ncbi:MAG: carboxymuconolactone decarboxylase family protein [Acidimicrobiia bacterium]|nr:carboxymuconolactone decarboxylase family protein [Acidimicrobiia bacterium]